MAVTQDKSGPYAPATAVVGIVERYRDRGLPAPITADVLAKAGVSESLVPRTLQTLQTLDLIDETGAATPTFELIRKAPEEEYQATLEQWLNGAYAEILAYVDPATADETALHNVFRHYNPPGQRARMVTLFTGLYRAAGIGAEKVAGGAPKKKAAAVKKPRADKPATPAGNAAQNNADGAGAGAGSGADKKPPSDFRAALLDKFPPFDPSWNDDLKAKWFDGFATFTKELGPK